MTKKPTSCSPAAGSHAERPMLTVPFMLLSVLFVVCLIISNLIEIKTVDLGWFTITAGVTVFPISYIINDCVVEIYGFRKARLMIWVGFAMSLMVSLFLMLAIALPGGDDWTAQAAMETIYGSVPRMMAASFAAFICGSMVNAYVMSRMKASANNHKSGGNRSFSLRAIVSTLWGESVDSLIFFPTAFAGILPWRVIGSLIVTQVLIKSAYEVMILPLTIAVVRRLKRIEDLDIVDHSISYKWWRISDI